MDNESTERTPIRYAVLIRPLSAEEGGGFLAMIPALGCKTFVADGETMAAALESLEALYADLMPELIEKGVRIPAATVVPIKFTASRGMPIA